jgi:cysteine desulfurase
MGVGVLYVRRRPRVRLEALIDGGGQERGMRSGTLPAPLCVGLGEACAIAEAEMAGEAERLGELRQRMYDGITARVPGVTLNGDLARRIPGNLNFSFAGVDGESLIAALDGLAVSTGSACTSAAIEPSYVLRALGVSHELADASIRFGLGRFTSAAEVDYAVDTVAAQVARLRAGGATRETA